MKLFKFLKDNLYIPVGSILVLAVFVITINGLYVGYLEYTREDSKMWGLMLVNRDGDKFYITNTNRGNVSVDINNIALVVKKKTAETAAKSLLKSEWLDDEPESELYVIEVVMVPVNPEKIEKPKRKTGYAIEYGDPEHGTVYYRSPKNRTYYSPSYDFGTSLTTFTAFKSEKEAQKVIDMIMTYVRHNEYEDDEKRLKWGSLTYSKYFNTFKERNDYLEKNMRIVKID